MHINIAHALASTALILVTMIALSRFGIVKKDEDRRWNWKIFGAIFCVMFVFNMIWSP